MKTLVASKLEHPTLKGWNVYADGKYIGTRFNMSEYEAKSSAFLGVDEPPSKQSRSTLEASERAWARKGGE